MLSHMDELTRTDRRLIFALKQDGRASVTTLAGVLGVSRATVQSRLERLVRTGVIRRFTIEVDAAAEVEVIRAVMMIEVAGKSTSQVIRRLRGLSELHKLHTTNGKWDLVAELRTDSLEDFDRVLREVRMIDGVENSETSLLLTSV